MKKTLTLLCVLVSALANAGGNDDPVLAKVMIDQLEWRGGHASDPLVLESEAWIGKDLNKLWFKLDAERVGNAWEEVEVQALFSHAIDPYWDMQIGWRHDARPKPDRDWLAVGVKGLAPYWFEVDAALFVGEAGRVAARVNAEYELMLTQNWVLSPEVQVDAYARDDQALGIGAGLTSVQAGLRLRYEVRREFAPYIGVNWTRKIGETALLTRQAGDRVDDPRLVVGVRAWF